MDSKTYAHQYSEALVEAALCKLGYFVYSNKHGKAPSDFLVEDASGVIKRVEVKSSSIVRSNTIGEFVEIILKSTRSNTTQNTVHKFDNSKVDLLAIVSTSNGMITILEAKELTQTASMRVYIKDMYTLENIK